MPNKGEMMHIVHEGERLTARKILLAMKKYKLLNLLIVLLFLLGGVLYLYLKQPQYQSVSKIEFKNLGTDQARDLFGNPIPSTTGIQTQIDILKSDMLLEQTMADLNMGVTYLHTDQYRTRELYKSSPFVVRHIQIKDPKFDVAQFEISPVSAKQYHIRLEPSLLDQARSLIPVLGQSEYRLDGIYTYGKEIDTPHFSFVVEKNVKEPFKKGVYSFTIAQEPTLLEQIRKRLRIHPASYMSQVLSIEYRDATPYKASDFVNRLVANYLRHNLEDESKESAHILQFVTHQLQQVNGKLNHSQTRLQNFKTDHEIADLAAQREALISKLSDFTAQYHKAHLERQVLEALYRSVKKGRYGRISAISDRYPTLGTLYHDLQSLQIEKEQKLVKYTPAHPSVRNLDKSIQKVKRSIVDVAAGILQKTRFKERDLAKVVREYRAKLRALPQQEQQLSNYRRLYEVNDKIYNYLLQKQSQLSIEKAAAVSNRKILDPARPNLKPVAPKVAMVMALSFLLGLLMALLHTLLRAKFDTKIKSTEDVKSLSKLPVYGMIPFVKQKKNYNKAFVLNEPNAPASEAYRHVKNNLEYLMGTHTHKVILVTSTVPNEGKTTFASNLAAILGMGDKSVILLSLDLRRPELHHKFGLSNKMGMSDLLSGRMQLEEVVWEHQTYEHLNIITSGPIPPNPAELIASERMEHLIDELRKEYDYIVIDTPPLHLASDATVLMQYADVTLFVLKSEFSEEAYVKEIEETATRLHLSNAGFVLTAVKPKYNTKEMFDKRYIYYEAT